MPRHERPAECVIVAIVAFLSVLLPVPARGAEPVLRPSAATVVQRAVKRLPPPWSVRNLSIRPDSVRTRLCTGPEDCRDLVLSRPGEGCAGATIGPWCVTLGGTAPDPSADAVLRAAFGRDDPEDAWFVPTTSVPDGSERRLGVSVVPDPDDPDAGTWAFVAALALVLVVFCAWGVTRAGRDAVEPARLPFVPTAGEWFLAWLLCFGVRAVVVWAGWIEASTWTPETLWKDGVLAGTSLDFDPIRPPLFSLLANLFWWVGGRTVDGWLVANMVVLGLTGPVVLRLSSLLGLPRTAAWAASVLAAGAPLVLDRVFGEPFLASQWQNPMTTLVFTAMLTAFVHAFRSGFGGWSGPLFSLAAFVAFLDRPNVLTTLLVLFGLAAFRAVAVARAGGARVASGLAGIRRSLAILGLLLLGLATAYWQSGLWFSPVPPQAGWNVYMSNNPYVAGTVCDPDWFTLELTILGKGPPEGSFEGTNPKVDADRALTRAGLEYAGSHPLETLKTWPCKAARYWGGIPLLDFLARGDVEPVRAVTAVAYHALVLLGLALLLVRRRWWVAAILVLAPLSFFLPHLMLGPMLRYRLTTEMCLVVMAGYGAQQIASAAWRLTGRGSPPRRP